MAVTNTAAFPQTVRSATAVCTAAKTTYADSTNAVSLIAAGGNGTEITHLSCQPLATITATQVQLYRGNGSTYRLISTALIPAYAMAQTTQTPTTRLTHGDGEQITETNPLRLASGDTLHVAIGVALTAGVAFDCQGRDF